MIRIDVTRQLGAFSLETRFESETAGITALFGRSGAGKTSIVNMLAGLLRPDRGHIDIDGTVLFDSEKGIDLRPEKRRLGYVFQQSRLFPHYSVRRNLEYGKRRIPASERRVAVDDVVEVLGIAPLLERRPGALSGGERQRVALGRALLASPKLLLMDEPLASLDAARKQEILSFIERLRDHFAVPIIYVSHSMDEIIRLADTLVLVDGGQVAAVGPVEELTSRLDLRPLTGRYEAGSVIAATVAGHDPIFNLTEVRFAGGTFHLPRIDNPVGATVRVRIRARDVSLSLTRPEGVSELNIFKGRIMEIDQSAASSQDTQIDIRVDIGVPLWVRVTRRALHDLALQEGSEVYTLVKSTSIDRQTLSTRKTIQTSTAQSTEEQPR
ncbi:MAG: molybdenum ABC transporter ATP-binding protein [Rhodospirillaceae bacterium]|jgi:molybdate transport system ATP-binding protein|nr:molybdenum ABC transporter ATP-binding protein [Rhodospirillaceae bacterium]MBT5459869.1 molybdenum ABC transporter ATP-binding protein [Rhodospirillaceae bacterium]